jgi:phage tail sheath gpL-like
MATPQIVGWSSNDKVPGVGGETQFGGGASSAASIPITMLVVGTKGAAGTAVPNQDIVPILGQDDIDTKLGLGFEASLMCASALRIPGVTLFCAPVAEAVSAVAATMVLTIAGTPTAAGSWIYRFNGVTYTGGISTTDTATTIATAIAAAVNADVRGAFTATSALGVVTLTAKSKGNRGNQFLAFQDLSRLPSGVTSSLTGTTAAVSTAYTTASYVTPTPANGYYYKATTAGTSGAAAPIWPTTIGTSVTDGTVVWTCWGAVLTGGITQFGGGAGTETNTTLLNVLQPAAYDRIACAENDATNLAAWRTQLDAQAGPTSNITQHFIAAMNATLSATQAIAQTTLNHPRFQVLWQLNGESHPAILAAVFAALRLTNEQTDPAASQVYDDMILPGIAPQSQKLDWPSHATLVAALNNSVTPVYTSPDGYARICRSIQTRSLNGSTPDYRVLDTSDAIVPDFVRKDLSLYWTTSYKPANPRVSDDPPAGQKDAASGVATPTRWNNIVEGRLRKMERGEGFPAGIIIQVDQNKPTSGYDPAGKRIMTAAPCVPAPGNHQVGISVRGQQAA